VASADRSADLDAARKRLDEVIERFHAVAKKAIDAAADPRLSRTAVIEAHHAATFGLAAVGAAFKAAVRLARPDEPAL